MGYDAFGLPAEQYAIQTGVHPSITTVKAIESFRSTLTRYGFSFDWSRDGKMMACSRGVVTTDVVLIKDNGGAPKE